MEKIKIMPRHLLLIFLPVAAAVLGGMLFSGDMNSFTRSSGGGGISQAQLYLGLSLLTGALAFGHRCLPAAFRWVIVVLLPLLFSFQVLPQLGKNTSLTMIYLLNLAFAIGLWFALRMVFFSASLIRVRTALFAISAAVLLTIYFRILFLIMGLGFAASGWSGYFWNSLFLFIFTAFGLSVADVMIIRKDLGERPAAPEPEEPEDIDPDA